MSQAEQTVALMGHNMPPEPTPYERSLDEISGLYIEACNWLDGSGVRTKEDADAVSLLIDELRKAIKRADERRVAENKPFDDGKAEVQARYAPLIADTTKQKGKAVLALEVCKKALKPFLDALDAEKRAKAEAARREAEEKAQQAQEAIRQARIDDLQARAAAEALVADAKKAEAAANKAEKDKAVAKGGSRAIGLTVTWHVELDDLQAWARHAWTTYPVEMRDFLGELAERKVDAGLRSAPGLIITEERVVR